MNGVAKEKGKNPLILNKELQRVEMNKDFWKSNLKNAGSFQLSCYQSTSILGLLLKIDAYRFNQFFIQASLNN